jgi:hypothetical protein
MVPDWLREIFDAHDREMAELKQAERQRERMAKQSEPAGLICKTDVTPPTPPAHQQQSAAMTQKQYDDGFNKWFAESFENYIDAFLRRELAPALVEYVCTYVGEKIEATTAKLRDELTAEIGGLRADVTIDRALHKQVLTLPNFLPARDRNVA